MKEELEVRKRGREGGKWRVWRGCVGKGNSKNYGKEHRRRIKKEEKAKVVAAVWWTELINFLAALYIFHQEDFEKKDA